MADRPSQPPRAREKRPLWRRIVGWPVWTWKTSREIAEKIAETFRIKNRLARGACRIGIFLFTLIIVPLMWPLRRYFDGCGARRVEEHVEQLWQSNPYEAVQVLRSVCQRVRAALPKRGFLLSVDIPPYGRIAPADLFYLDPKLFRCEMVLGRWDEALAFAQSLDESWVSVSMQVDALVAMGRTADAVHLLRQKLHLDLGEDQLHKKLASLTGTPGPTTN
jgi:hypothetical protein